MKRHRHLQSRGFTIVELLVVMGIFGLILAMISVVRPRHTSLRLQAETQSLVRDFIRARETAVMTNAEVVVSIDTRSHRVSRGQMIRKIPDDVAVSMTISDDERVNDWGGIRFYPDGQASGGEVKLALGGLKQRIVVSWMTGQPRIIQ